MILTRNWLQKFMDLSGISNDEISVALNSLGFEVEETKDYSKLNKGLVIGKVVESEKIPDSHLTVNKVQLGEKKFVQIVCGAPNVKEGIYVIVAPIGSTIAAGITMDERELLGYKSEGMICSLSEIGVSPSVLTEEEQNGIYIIESYNNLDALIGKGVDAIGFDDYIWDMDLTLNRSDALSSVQLLKELGNYFHSQTDFYRLDNKVKDKKNIEDINLKIAPSLDGAVNTAGYSIFMIDNYEDKLNVETDLWLKFNNCKSTGNYLYDLANVMAIEIAQPVILIDYDKLKSKDISLGTSTIDDQELVALKDGQSIIDVIGLEVENKYRVTDKTKQVLAIYFNFNPVIMRTQQKRLNTSNVALQRYIKPLYANKFEDANETLKDIFDDYALISSAHKLEYLLGPVIVHNEIETSVSYLNYTLGTEFNIDEIKDLFEDLQGFEIKGRSDDMTFICDPNRIDITGEKEVAEEVARIYGYDRIIPKPLVIKAMKHEQDLNADLQKKVTNYLIGAGLMNIKTYSLVNEEDNKHWNLFNLKKPVKLMSPLSNLHEVYRMSLGKSMIDIIQSNSAKGNKNLKLFEIADVYTTDGRQTHLAWALSGEFNSDFRDRQEANFFYLKGILEDIFDLYNVDQTKVSYELIPTNKVIAEIHPYQNAKIKIGAKTIGFIYCLNPRYEEKNKLGKTFVGEIDLGTLFSVINETLTIKEVSKYQASSRDISLETSTDLAYQELIKELLDGVDYITDYKLIDIYQSEEMKKENKIALSISITFNNLTNQLNDATINGQWDKILNNAKEMKVKVR
ncbi:phenylalanine--tRNA ligase subunit beta [Mesoplasma lactucae]|uniref:Phenylalanine--tRNA ligase beta subunit n=1 Tax=Mesoplasma lactucae ATCC 49193 TaxID=81460 RepID=A0A291IS27_9MOLU|nr:phenylalanine--tRNA ligase subunit beta [Mesoplasma lactucae]ATG97491.1 phenylalanine--tRNA ligase subunit beta [Mesoplasma lactucae ATCC 49193]ATZ20054.1 phenylalanyl-tRNA synthetase subunit beta [Mesoplasma lactucae ATCC 49193]MCL8216802.1 Phenylalanine--tRNA ligase beta subunit [Mesoplasma lactucae ATCC 49193]